MVVVFLISFALVVFICQILTAKFKIATEISRKISHVLSCFISLGFYPVLNLWEVTLIGVLAIVFLWVVQKLKKVTFLDSHTRKTYGEYFLILGIYSAFLLASILENFTAYIFAIVVLALADTAAAFGGIVSKSGKTNFGSGLFLSVYLIISLITSLFFSDFNLWLLISLGIIVTIAERVSFFGSDNLLIPTISYLSFYISTK